MKNYFAGSVKWQYYLFLKHLTYNKRNFRAMSTRIPLKSAIQIEQSNLSFSTLPSVYYPE